MSVHILSAHKKDQELLSLEVSAGSAQEKGEGQEEEESECAPSPPPAKRTRRKSSKDKQVKVAPDLGKMTMAELISYNPSTNPMQ